MPEYIVFVMPPEGEDAEPFDIPEWGYIEAVATWSVTVHMVGRRALSTSARRSCCGGLCAQVAMRSASWRVHVTRHASGACRQRRLQLLPDGGLTMRDFVYTMLTAVGIVATAVAAAYAFADRGYFAVGGEYAFLALPLLGMCIEYMVKDRWGGRRRNADR